MKIQDLPNKTHLEIFDFISKHLLKQNEKSVDAVGETGVGQCVYLSSEGLKCAVGCLIDSKDYNKGMEGSSVYTVLDKFYSDIDIPSKTVYLLRTLQNLHDGCSPGSWKAGLAEIKENLKSDL